MLYIACAVLWLLRFALGASIFSFLGVVIWRLPRGESVVKGRSHCPACGHTLFRYTAKDIDGRTVRGTMEAADYDALYAQLLEQGLYPQRVTGRGADRRPRTLRPQELSDLCRQLSTLLASGVSLVRALTIISQDEGISAGLRRVYESVLSEVRKGSSLSDALEAQQVFPALMLGMIRAGEGSGRLDRVAERLAVHYEKAHQMNQQVKSALMYPMILAVLSVAVVIVTFVLPQFSDLFSTMDSLPAVTLALMAFSDFMVTKWYLLLLGLAALAAALRALRRVPSVRLALDRGKLTMPVFGKLHRIICTARFARTISSLYASGLPIITALQTARDTIGNAYIVSQFDAVLAQVRSGVSLSAALESVDGFQRKLCSSIAVGEETGQLDSMLDSIADSMEYDAQQASRRMMTILEPMLIVLMAFVVGFIIIAVMSPIIGSYSAIESSGNV